MIRYARHLFIPNLLKAFITLTFIIAVYFIAYYRDDNFP